MGVDWAKQKWLIYVLLAIVVIIGVSIRLQNTDLLANSYLPAKDPYVFLRYADNVVTSGHVPSNDTLRFAPQGFDTTREHLVLPYSVAFFHKAAAMVGLSGSITQSAIIFPPILFGIFLILFFFVIRKLTDNLTALTATTILVFLNPFLHRTMAGHLDKEVLAIIFFFLAFWAFFKTEEWWFYGVLAGVFTGVTGLTWGGMRFILITIALTAAVLWVMKRFPIKSYWVWICTTIIFLLFTPRYQGVTGILTSIDTALPLCIGLLPVLDKARAKWAKNLPRVWGVVGILAGIGLVGGLIAWLMGHNVFDRMISEVLFPLGADRLTMSVSESQLPTLGVWWSRWRWLGLLAFAGVIAWFYQIVKPLRFKGVATTGFATMLLLWLVTRASSRPPLNGFSTQAKLLFIIPTVLWFGFMAWLLWWHEKKHHHQFTQFCKTKTGFIFVIALFMLTFLAARGASRFFFVLSIPVAILLAWFVIRIVQWAWAWKTKTRWTIITITFVILALLLLPHVLITINAARHSGHQITEQWQDAFTWLATETGEQEAVAAWWDYGYWIQTIGQRPTLLDGGNFHTYWNHLFGRIVMTGTDPEQARRFLTSHNVTYLLLNPNDITTYSAFSLLGSDESFDRLSRLGVLRGKSNEDNVITFEGRVSVSGGRLIKTEIGWGVEDNRMKITRAAAYIKSSQGIDTPGVSCIFADEQMWDTDGLDGCMYALHSVSNGKISRFTGLLYAPQTVHDSLWAQLYLQNKNITGFELVYDDGSLFTMNRRGGVRGPIRVWKVEPVEPTETQHQLWNSHTSPEWEFLRNTLPYG